LYIALAVLPVVPWLAITAGVLLWPAATAHQPVPAGPAAPDPGAGSNTSQTRFPFPIVDNDIIKDV
jgi:hypothetical protein